jgi:hypothetical protein
MTHTNTFNLEVGDTITFTNSVNYFVTLVVTRVEEKSWYVGSSRNSYGTLAKYSKCPDFKITKPTPGNPEFTTHKVMYKGQEVEAINFGKL